MKYCIVILLFVFAQSLPAQSVLPFVDSIINKRYIHFVPASFSNKFSLNEKPVLTISSGDTVSTETIDALGFDKNGTKRQHGGNPLTGPFFIEDAKPEDILVVTLTRVALNRSYAYTTESFSSRCLPKTIIKQLKKPKLIRWKLDTAKNYAFPDTAYEHLQAFKVPLKPFIGCIGVAPTSKKNEVLSFFPGNFGGNLDFSGIKQSATVYLPVFHEGAYFYIGDGHAVQGDGELTGNALETSMDIEFTIRIIKNFSHPLAYPRVEDETYIMAIGLDESLDNAFKNATAALLEWLQTDYHLSLEEASQVMSTSVEYTIAEVTDPEVEIVAKIKKEILTTLKKYN